MLTVEASGIRVGVCEDDEDLRDILLQGLSDAGFIAFGLPSAEALCHFLTHANLDILLLDIGLPGEDGYSVAHRLRQEYPTMGIIMTTARGALDDRVRGLLGGADTYLVKPLELTELIASIGSLHRRLPQAPHQGTTRNLWQLDRLHATLHSPAGHAIPLAENECKLLSELLGNPGATIQKEHLLACLGWNSKHRLEALISRLRRKADLASPEEPLPIRARHGDGYAFLSAARTL